LDLKKFNIKEIYYENCNVKNHDRLVTFLTSFGFKIEKELFENIFVKERYEHLLKWIFATTTQ
jgi:hypothetical protein